MNKWRKYYTEKRVGKWERNARDIIKATFLIVLFSGILNAITFDR